MQECLSLLTKCTATQISPPTHLPMDTTQGLASKSPRSNPTRIPQGIHSPRPVLYYPRMTDQYDGVDGDPPTVTHPLPSDTPGGRVGLCRGQRPSFRGRCAGGWGDVTHYLAL